MIAIGSCTTDTVDSDFACGETEEHHYSDSLSSLPRGRCFVRLPWPVSSTTLEMERLVDEYLNGKSLADQIQLAKLMAHCEHEDGIGTPRSRTSTLEAPWLQQSGASLAIRDEWHKRMGG